MADLREYILSTFNYCINIDSAQLSQYSSLSLLENGDYNVYITPIRHPNFTKKQNRYNYLVKKAFNIWSEALFEKNIKFHIISTPYQADIKVYWTKSNRYAAGMQFCEENLNYRNRCFTIGIAEMDWEPYSEDEVYHIILHEIGHVFGLGHSRDEGNIMSITGEWVTELSENDIKVLNLVYAIDKNKSYSESINFINYYLSHWNERVQRKPIEQNKNLEYILSNIGYVKLFNLLQPEIQIDKKILSCRNLYQI
ncbi:matrixin family metalloprotease [bacterium]|nr:matrixin family metalloprotease [bacterium]